MPCDSFNIFFWFVELFGFYVDSGEDLNNTVKLQKDVFPIRAVKNMREKRTHRKFANF